MAQQRFINFGDTVLADRINQISTAIVESGVLSGAEFSVFDAETLTVGPSSVMLPSLLLIESAATNLGASDGITVGGAAKNWTIVYEHTNQNVQGGAAAALVVKDGIFSFGDLENTVILGWVRYPGGSVPLETGFFIEAPKLQITNPATFPSDIMLPPYLDKIHVQKEWETPGSILQTNGWDPFVEDAEGVYVSGGKAFLELENTSISIQSIRHLVPFYVVTSPPDRLVVEVSAELQASVTVALVAEDGTIFSATNNTISNTSSLFEFREMTVEDMDDSKFAPDRPYFVSLTTQLNPGKKAFISLVGTNTNYLPF
jgi:hypothetical protein